MRGRHKRGDRLRKMRTCVKERCWKRKNRLRDYRGEIRRTQNGSSVS